MNKTISNKLYDSAGTFDNLTHISYVLTKDNSEIVMKFNAKPTTLKGLFAYSDASKINFENFQTEDVQTMELMFYACKSLTQLEISNWNTSSVKICIECLIIAKN